MNITIEKATRKVLQDIINRGCVPYGIIGLDEHIKKETERHNSSLKENKEEIKNRI